MPKRNTSKSKDPNSNRSKKRKKRGFTMSRPNRRAERRLAEATNGYKEACRGSTTSGIEFKKPGAMKHW